MEVLIGRTSKIRRHSEIQIKDHHNLTRPYAVANVVAYPEAAVAMRGVVKREKVFEVELALLSSY